MSHTLKIASRLDRGCCIPPLPMPSHSPLHFLNVPMQASLRVSKRCGRYSSSIRKGRRTQPHSGDTQPNSGDTERDSGDSPPPFHTRSMHPCLKFHRISQSQHSTPSFVPCLAFFRGLSHLEHCLPFPHVTIGLLRRPPHISPCHLAFTPLHCFSCSLSSCHPICRSSSGFLPLAHHLA